LNGIGHDLNGEEGTKMGRLRKRGMVSGSEREQFDSKQRLGKRENWRKRKGHAAKKPPGRGKG